MTELTVRAATAADVSEVARVLGVAFAEDPVMSWIFPDPQQRRKRLPLFFQAIVRHWHLQHGGIELAGNGQGAVGAAIWDPPGKWKPTAWQNLVAGPALLRALGRRVMAGQSVGETLEKHHPSEPHWYLSTIGTDPAARGQGVGGRLLRSRLSRCDEAGLPAYLESSNEANVPIYERFEFTVTREIVIPKGGPTVWAMWRKPN